MKGQTPFIQNKKRRNTLLFVTVGAEGLEPPKPLVCDTSALTN